MTIRDEVSAIMGCGKMLEAKGAIIQRQTKEPSVLFQSSVLMGKHGDGFPH